MPYYPPLKEESSRDRKRTVAGLKRLRKQFKEVRFPNKKTSDSLILGTWNIRNFDDDRFNYGPRSTEALYYIAEIISKFDVLAIQEVCQDLRPLDRLINIAGREYDYILTDVTHSGLGGNKERLGFIFDRNKVNFKGIAGEIVLPDKMLISEVEDKKRQFSRTPFGVMFQSGWFKFFFSTVHIYFGSNSPSSEKYARRVKEIDAVAAYLAKEAKANPANHILVGDFNIKKAGSAGYNALEKNGFTCVNNRLGSNRDQTKFYDQISFISKYNELQLMEEERDDRVFQFFDSVYRDKDFKSHKAYMTKRIKEKIANASEKLDGETRKTYKKKLESEIKKLNGYLASEEALEKYYEEWRTFQMSDHLPLWVELKIDFTDGYLEYLEDYKPKK